MSEIGIEVYGVAAIITFFGLIEMLMGVYGHRSVRSKNDWLVEVLSFGMLTVLIKPFIYLLVHSILALLLPEMKDEWSDLSFWWALPLVLLVDDVQQYWYHRMSHVWPFLWKLHRPHHVAREMGVLISYRNANLYYLLMPNIYWLALATYLGMTEAVAISIVLKQIVVSAAHSPTRWDRGLYRYRFMHPLAWLTERIISTPSTHFAHHGLSDADGVSNPNGNFSNMFFIWDVIFGTARINRKYPTQFGIADDPNDPWYAHLWYPIVKSDKKGSELSK